MAQARSRQYATFTDSNVIFMCPPQWAETFAANFVTQLAGRMVWGTVKHFKRIPK